MAKRNFLKIYKQAVENFRKPDFFVLERPEIYWKSPYKGREKAGFRWKIRTGASRSRMQGFPKGFQAVFPIFLTGFSTGFSGTAEQGSYIFRNFASVTEKGI